MEAWEFIIILFWVTIILIVFVGAYLYLNNRTMSKKLHKMQQKLNTNHTTIQKMKKSSDERLQKLIEIQNQVDKMIEEDKKNI